jgi:hypothetical protein
MKKRSILAVAAVAVAVFVTGAYAAVTFDPESGEGFVGKGDVQEALGWNNKQLQDNAEAVAFSVESVAENTWLCYNSRSGQTNERNNTVTMQGLVSAVARERNQITGFQLTGYDGAPETAVDGQATGTCPGENTTLVEGSIEEGEASEFTLFVNGVELQ